MVFIPYTPPEVVEEIKKIDLLTYLQNYEPDELVKIGTNTYTTKTHDSIRISNGLWNWFSRGIVGRSAVYYIKEDINLSFKEAIDFIAEKTKIQRPIIYQIVEENIEKELMLPQKNDNCNRAKYYLMKRGIDAQIIEECVNENLIYEEKNNHNVVFVGYDKKQKAQYAFCRGTNETRFMKEAKGSNKIYTFRLISNTENNRVHLFESAIDLLSYATLMKQKNLDYHKENMISLAGVFKPSEHIENIKLPVTITKFLEENPQVNQIHLHLDNDEVGRKASQNLVQILSKKYKVLDRPPPIGKDCNDYLKHVLGIRNITRNTKEKVR